MVSPKFRDSPLHKFQCTFSDVPNTEAVYENSEDYTTKLVNKDKEAESHFYEQPKSMGTTMNYAAEVNSFENAIYGNEENIYANT
ncbi:UNVERIFIED_CONTAM: hypothetical protein NCL1_20413 [Trichonephila clavipes]